jgi:hypothetical protein
MKPQKSSHSQLLNLSLLLLLSPLIYTSILHIFLRLNAYLNLLRPPIQTLRLEHIQVHRESKRNHKPDQRNKERMLRIPTQSISNTSQHRREQCPSTDSCNDEACSSLTVSTKSAEGEREDERKDAGLKEEDETD